jgi:hypothetical protein
MAKTILLFALLALLAGASGCKNSSGSREYVPGKGWKQN